MSQSPCLRGSWGDVRDVIRAVMRRDASTTAVCTVLSSIPAIYYHRLGSGKVAPNFSSRHACPGSIIAVAGFFSLRSESDGVFWFCRYGKWGECGYSSGGFLASRYEHMEAFLGDWIRWLFGGGQNLACADAFECFDRFASGDVGWLGLFACRIVLTIAEGSVGFFVRVGYTLV